MSIRLIYRLIPVFIQKSFVFLALFAYLVLSTESYVHDSFAHRGLVHRDSSRFACAGHQAEYESPCFICSWEAGSLSAGVDIENPAADIIFTDAVPLYQSKFYYVSDTFYQFQVRAPPCFLLI